MLATVLVTGILIVIGLDTLGSLASRKWSFRYSALAPLSFLAYAAVGYLAARSGTAVQAAATAGAVGLIDATVGWRISWLIGPGRLPVDQARPNAIAQRVAIVVVLAVLLGFAGAVVARRAA